MAPKKKFARVDASSRFRTVALGTLWTSVVFGVGFGVGRVAPDNLLERFGPQTEQGARATVGVEVPVVPREVYTVDNEMVRRRDEARAATASGAPAAPSRSAEGQAAIVEPTPPAPNNAPAPVAEPGIGVAAQDPGTEPAQPRVVARSVAEEPDPAAAPVPPRPARVETPPPRPTDPNVAPSAAAPAATPEPRVVRRAVGAPEGASPFELEVLQPGSEAAAQSGRERLAAAGLDAHVVPSSDGRFRVVIRGRAGAEEQERQRRLAQRVLSGEL